MAESPLPFTIETFTAGDGYRWRYRHFTPTREPKANVVCVHGIQSHGGWYTYSATRLRNAGFAVYFLDRRGAGLNDQDRGDAPSFRRLMADVAEFLTWLRQRSSRPIFLVGISWGGKLVTALQRRYPGLTNGLVLMSPGFFSIYQPSLFHRIKTLFITRLVAPRRLYDIPLTEPELFTASPHWRRFIAEDPLMLRQGTTRLAVENGRLDGYLRLFRVVLDIPVLLMLAEHDRIIDNAATRRFIESVTRGPLAIIEYPGAHHTLEFEPNPDLFINDLIAWLERHLILAQTALSRCAP
ncbi:MAG: alpha/beta fold hydrolase [Gemmataceae bacterium]